MVAAPEFTDPRLAAVYDLVNPAGADTAFYVALADELDARTIADIGCGTGLLLAELGRPGRRLVGIDPAPEMLAVARRRPTGGDVTWVDGDSGALRGTLGAMPADLVLMTGHVAQLITDDQDWLTTLAAVRGALRPGGVLAFESRNPGARGWLGWTPHASRRVVGRPGGGELEVWYDVLEVRVDRVKVEVRYRFPPPGPELRSVLELRYRTEDALVESLTDAGFTVEQVYGDWDRTAVGPASPELVVIARSTG